MRRVQVSTRHIVALVGRVVDGVAADVRSILEAASWLRLVVLACGVALPRFSSAWSVCVQMRNRELLDGPHFAELALANTACVFLCGAGDIFVSVLLRGHRQAGRLIHALALQGGSAYWKTVSLLAH